jgi:two-component system cell cycle sensor histidine kinase/response regulator CckA
MKPVLRVLLVGKSDEDAEAVTRELAGAFDLEVLRVQTPGEARTALADRTYDVIVGRGQDAEAALRASEARFRDLFETAPDGILAVDGGGVIVLANAAAAGMFGYDTLLGEPVELLVPRAVREAHAGYRTRFFAKPERRKTGGGRSLEGVRKGGTTFPVEVSLGPSVVDGQPVVLAIVRDMTERAALEHRFLQSQKLEAIGRLAAGVAHDFNNLLSVVLSYSALVLGELKPADPMRDDVQEIHGAALRASGLTRQLLAFGRRQILSLQPTNLGAVVGNLESMLRRVLGEDIELTILAKPDIGTVVVDPGQIEQVVMNLVVNARDAMPTGGKLTLEASNVTLDEPYAVRHGVSPGAYVMLAVTDTGTGMDSETQTRAFEPFFTTKEHGKGTGLGLSTVFGIVQQSGGHIWLYTEPGQGTTFKIYFPRKEETGAKASLPPPSPTRHGNETILLVEDDDALRNVATTILRRQGYHVLVARTGGDALLLCEQHGAKIHLLLTDVVMPRMSGRQLADRLRPLRSDMKVLFMSGYTDDSIVQHGVLDSDAAFLEKPITPESLARKVREVLDA